MHISTRIRIKGREPLPEKLQNQLSHPGFYHTEQEFQESLIEGKIRNQQNSNEGFKYLQS